jgi:sugar porter (SP) family MFS transporter
MERPVAGNVYRGFAFFALGGLLFGYSIGVSSNFLAKGQLRCCRAGDTCADPTDAPGAGMWDVGYGLCYDLGSLEVGLMTSLSIMGALVGSIVCFNFADVLGRNKEAALGAACYTLGGGIAAASPVLAGVMFGLTLYGVGIGLAMHAAPLYIAEISPASVRGALVAAKEGVIVLGIFLGFAVGAVFQGAEGGWRLMLTVGSVFGALMAIGLKSLPRSPRWLAFRCCMDRSRGEQLLGEPLQEEARRALRFYRGTSTPAEVDDELEQIFADAESSCSVQKSSWTDSFSYPKPLGLGLMLVILQQVTGQPSVLYFANTIFQSAGFASASALSSSGIGLVKLLATLVTVSRVDNYGRRTLLLVGIAVMLVALLMLAAGFMSRTCSTGALVKDCAFADLTLPSSWAAVVVVALMLYVIGYQIGFGPIVWLLISEIFPLRVRGPAMSIAVLMNFSANLVMTFTLEGLLQVLTPPGVFFMYAGLTVFSLVYVYFACPETKGKTLEEIEAIMCNKKPATARAPVVA